MFFQSLIQFKKFNSFYLKHFNLKLNGFAHILLCLRQNRLKELMIQKNSSFKDLKGEILIKPNQSTISLLPSLN